MEVVTSQFKVLSDVVVNYETISWFEEETTTKKKINESYGDYSRVGFLIVNRITATIKIIYILYEYSQYS